MERSIKSVKKWSKQQSLSQLRTSRREHEVFQPFLGKNYKNVNQINLIYFSLLLYSTSVVVNMEEVGDLEVALGVIVGMQVVAVEVDAVVQYLEEQVGVDWEEESMTDQVVEEVLVEVVVLRPAIL